MPIEWDELSDPKLAPDRWTVRTAGKRLADQGDAWTKLARHARNLPASL
jgi:bifunctional non-homologous end joining protein LigD